MEDIQRDLEKTLKAPAFSKSKKRSIPWTLLFVGDNGKIIRGQNFKFLVIAWISALFISTTAAAGLYYLYQDNTQEIDSLKQVLNSSREKARSLRDEKDILMARLVVAESKIRSDQPISEQKKIEKTKPLEPIAEISPLPEPEPAQVIKTIETRPSVASIEPVEQEVSVPETTIQEADEDVRLEVVDIDDFFALIEEDSNTLRIKYKIRNVSQSPKPVSGRTFMVLKGEEEDQKNWLALPGVPLVSGKPSRINNGRPFSITRFKTIRFKSFYQNGDKPFSAATILVYSTAGELLLEKSFPIKKEGEETTPVN